jgi:hypothetical protein
VPFIDFKNATTDIALLVGVVTTASITLLSWMFTPNTAKELGIAADDSMRQSNGHNGTKRHGQFGLGTVVHVDGFVFCDTNHSLPQMVPFSMFFSRIRTSTNSLGIFANGSFV